MNNVEVLVITQKALIQGPRSAGGHTR